MVLFDYNGNLALKAKWMWESKLIARKNYDTLVRRDKINVLHRSAPGIPAIISYNSLPYSIKQKVDAKLQNLGELPEPVSKKEEKTCFFEKYIKGDAAAMSFYGDKALNLPPEKQQEYYLNAQILNAFRDLSIDRTNARNAQGARKRKRTGVFTSVLSDLKLLDRKKYPHTLPLSERNLKPKYKQYLSEGYNVLLHGNIGNDNKRIVTTDIEYLFLSIAAMSNNPYVAWVQSMYLDFLRGKATIYNTYTGEIYNREDFRMENGMYP
jgi:hypothetical protein